ncbi:MAG: SpoIIE family protein phosphatase [Bdellovibrionota bacterium]
MSRLIEYSKSFSEALKAQLLGMFGASFRYAELEEIKAFQVGKGIDPTQALWVQVPFSGTISGDYFLCFNDQDSWKKIVGNSELFAQLGASAKLDDLLDSSLKELLNIVVGEAIVALSEDFPNLTFLVPRITRGSIDYPKVSSVKVCLDNPEFGRITAYLCMNLMKQDIGMKLEEQVEFAAREAKRAVLAELTTRSILENVKLGLFKIDKNGLILPGCSRHLAKLFFSEDQMLEGRNLLDACPEGISGQHREKLLQWIERAPEGHAFHEVGFKKDGIDFVYSFSFFDASEDLGSQRIVAVEDITEKVMLEKKLLKETAAKSALERDLETAQEVQRLFFPENAFQSTVANISGRSQAATRCGGDWWFYHQVGPFLIVIIGDVTGHGASAALLTAAVYGAFTSLIAEYEKKPCEFICINEILERLNAAVYSSAKGKKLMTMSISVINLKTGILEHVNSAHLHPLVYRPKQEAGPSSRKDFMVIEGSGSHLGLSATIDRVKPVSFQLMAGDLIFWYTDGLFECSLENGKRLKKLTFLSELAKTRRELGESAILISEAVSQQIKRFFGETYEALSDDLTFIIGIIYKNAVFGGEPK